MPRASSMVPALKKDRGIIRIDDVVVSATLTTVPMTITKMIAVSVNPNQRIAIGSQQMLGSV